ncbi:phosphodiester glycosidase family protein [uncultured Sphingomonas sp.]|uniref:phosphodiester glycosidase family protein n=1 Tax=uncultured Sphingomonas sp. TaxID=158754 RepID=UPI0025E5EE44|nr:phosphodiester glycosidase family protein [uncultured Sphingomonas sp.]
MKLIVALLLLLAACRKADSAPADDSARAADSRCRQMLFEGSRFTVCRDPRARVEVRTAGRDGRPFRSFAALEHVLGHDAGRVRFAMNAGMFDADGRAIGLLIEHGRELHPINRREGGGNFHLLPNGVFLVREGGKAEIVTSAAFEPAADIAFATQSGPMLVIDGKLHPAFEPDGRSRFVRNGVGIAPDGTLVFVISEDAVSFGKFARFFRDGLKCRNALYFDGSVSSLWDPVNHRMDSFAALGPMVMAFALEGEEGEKTR